MSTKESYMDTVLLVCFLIASVLNVVFFLCLSKSLSSKTVKMEIEILRLNAKIEVLEMFYGRLPATEPQKPLKISNRKEAAMKAWETKRKKKSNLEGKE